jgi:glycogen synthase kinase 3 beta
VYLWQLLSALDYLQQEGVAHRDVKPHNVLVDSFNNKVTLCDFGSAKQLIYGQANLSYVCARSYRAPELLLGSTTYSTQIDMWSLGCLAAEAINGCPLFKT